MLSSQQEQADRKQVLDNDKRGSTFLDHVTNDTGGRFTQIGEAHVIGSTAVPQYPAASAPFQRDPVPNEEPLGYRVDEMPDPEPSSFSSAQAPDPTSQDAPSLLGFGDVERVGVGSPSPRKPFRRF